MVSNALGCERTGSDKRQNCRLSLALSLENLGVRTGSVRACVRQIGMASYILEYVVIFIGICCHIYWNMLSYLLEYIIIFSGIYYHIYYNMSSYLFIVI